MFAADAGLVILADVERQHGGDARESVDHDAQQRAVAHAIRARRVEGREERPRVGRLQGRRFADRHHVPRAAHRLDS